MKTHHTNEHKDHNSLAEQTKALLVATEQATEDTVIEARNRLKSAMEATQEACAEVKSKAVAGVKATDKYVRANPYQAVGIAFGLGALLGFFMTRRGSRD